MRRTYSPPWQGVIREQQRQRGSGIAWLLLEGDDVLIDENQNYVAQAVESSLMSLLYDRYMRAAKIQIDVTLRVERPKDISDMTLENPKISVI